MVSNSILERVVLDLKIFFLFKKKKKIDFSVMVKNCPLCYAQVCTCLKYAQVHKFEFSLETYDVYSIRRFLFFTKGEKPAILRLYKLYTFEFHSSSNSISRRVFDPKFCFLYSR